MIYLLFVSTCLGFKLNPEWPVIKYFQGYSFLKLNDYWNIVEPGHPSLPFKACFVLVPSGERVENIKIEKIDSAIISLDAPVFPAQKPVPVGYEKDFIKFVSPDSKIYGSRSPYPPYDYKILGEQKAGPFSVLLLNLYPVKYVPYHNLVVVYDYKVSIFCRRQNYVEIRPYTKKQYFLFKKTLENLVVNPETFESYPVERR